MAKSVDTPSHIGVIGAGLMGRGIAQVAIQNGVTVTLVDASRDALDAGCAGIAKGLDILVKKEKLDESGKKDALARLTAVTEFGPLAKAEMIIEAIVEKEDIKVSVFHELDELCGPETIFTSNTSSISITRLGAATSRADKFAGMHFFNPVPIMRLVEIIRSPATADHTIAAVRALAERMGKVSVDVNDAPGFIANRVFMPMINEAIFALFEGVASAEDIDEAMMLGMNHLIGPLALADFIGLDTCLNIMRVIHADLGDPKYRPCPLLIRYVDAGWLGRKSGRGFFEYDENGKKV